MFPLDMKQSPPNILRSVTEASLLMMIALMRSASPSSNAMPEGYDVVRGASPIDEKRACERGALRMRAPL